MEGTHWRPNLLVLEMRRGESSLQPGVVGEPCVNQSIQANALLGGPPNEGTVHFGRNSHDEFAAVGAVGQLV